MEYFEKIKKYMVVYMVQADVNEPLDVDNTTDHYTVFNDCDTSEENYKDAKLMYDSLLKSENIYQANLVEILESTDYF